MTDIRPAASTEVFFLGESERTRIREGAVGDAGLRNRRITSIDATFVRGRRESVWFVGGPVADALEATSTLVREGCHVFMDIARSPSVRDLERLTKIAAEAGVAVGLSRPLRFASDFEGWSSAATVAIVDAEFASAGDSWNERLAATLDLCSFVCGSAHAQRVEASIVRTDGVWPLLAACSLRFDNGSLALVSLRRADAARPGLSCTAAFGSHMQQAEIILKDDAVYRETSAFLSEVRHKRRAPVQVSDGLACARLVEQVQASLR